MAAPALVLYVAINKEDMPSYVATGLLPRRHVGGRCYIGLRERPEDAFERASLSLQGIESVSKSTHVVLEWRLSAAALARFVTTCAGSEHSFASVLYKQTYSDTYDWKVWRYLGDLPLRGTGIDYDFRETQ